MTSSGAFQWLPAGTGWVFRTDKALSIGKVDLSPTGPRPNAGPWEKCPTMPSRGHARADPVIMTITAPMTVSEMPGLRIMYSVTSNNPFPESGYGFSKV
jgi:hypothetical protein